MRGSLQMRHVSDVLERWFPMPPLLSPPSVGIDISDKSIKWLALEKVPSGYGVKTYGVAPLSEGVVRGGMVVQVDALAQHLKALARPLGGIRYAHAALPEEEAYVFSMAVPSGSSHDQILRLIEFEFEGRVPIAPAEAVFDYDVIQENGADVEIGVAAFPRAVAEQYVEAFSRAGMCLVSLEIEAQSVARAIMPRDAGHPITLMVDFGRARTGFALIKNGVPFFTTTVGVGGDAIDDVALGVLSDDKEVERFKNEEGLFARDANAVLTEKMKSVAGALSDEVARHFHYWDTRRNERGERMTPVDRVMLVGGSANLKGLVDFVAGKVQAETVRGDVWRNVCSFDTYIPPIRRHDSLEYATAIGLALRGI